MSAELDAVDSARRSDLQRAARALLRRPVLQAGGATAEQFLLVRRRAEELREWFGRNTGWRLHVDGEVARLVKTTTEPDATHPARDQRTKAPFTRRRYVLFCLALAALERADAQITLGRLAEHVVLGASAPELAAAQIVFTMERRDERGDLVAVVRLLLELGILSRVAGDEEAFVRADGDVLYDVDRRVLATLIVTPRGPSTVTATAPGTRLAMITEELPPTTDELRNQQLRRGVTRRLLDDPVLYYAELTEAELAYLTSQRHHLTSRITELTGLVPEVRAEGLAMVDPADELTDVRMPESGTEGHATLLLAEHLAGRSVAVADLQRFLREQAAVHTAYWRRTAREPGAEIDLTEQALQRLEALKLVRRTGDEVHALPALSRYAVGEPEVT